MTKKYLFVIYIAILFMITACGGPIKVGEVEEHVDREDRIHEETTGGTKFFGQEGFLDLGNSKRSTDNGGASSIGVNAYLWRASLDSISFMPIAQVDPFGGVILTDWYNNPDIPNERFKINIFILGQQLKANGIKVSVFKQQRQGDTWLDVVNNSDTASDIENNILSRARSYRIAASVNK